MKHYIITEIDGKEIKTGKLKRVRISKYFWMKLKSLGEKRLLKMLMIIPKPTESIITKTMIFPCRFCNTKCDIEIPIEQYEWRMKNIDKQYDGCKTICEECQKKIDREWETSENK